MQQKKEREKRLVRQKLRKILILNDAPVMLDFIAEFIHAPNFWETNNFSMETNSSQISEIWFFFLAISSTVYRKPELHASGNNLAAERKYLARRQGLRQSVDIRNTSFLFPSLSLFPAAASMCEPGRKRPGRYWRNLFYLLEVRVLQSYFFVSLPSFPLLERKSEAKIVALRIHQMKLASSRLDLSNTKIWDGRGKATRPTLPHLQGLKIRGWTVPSSIKSVDRRILKLWYCVKVSRVYKIGDCLSWNWVLTTLLLLVVLHFHILTLLKQEARPSF